MHISLSISDQDNERMGELVNISLVRAVAIGLSAKVVIIKGLTKSGDHTEVSYFLK